MAMFVALEEKAAFYDPYYRPGAQGAPTNESDSRWFDEFSVFNHLHLPKQRGLSLSPPQVLRNSSSLRSHQQNGYVNKHNHSVNRLTEVSGHSNLASCKNVKANSCLTISESNFH